MFKLALKLSVFTLVLLSACVFLSGTKVEAASRCPNSFQDAQNNLDWGVTPQFNGSHGGNMAGVIVHAYDASTNQPVDTGYHLHSGISATDPNWGIVNGHQTNLNDRIFQDFNGTFDNRTNDYAGGTNSMLGLFTVQCSGWDAFGPADLNNTNIGNGYVLDCGPFGNPTHFWFSNLRSPPIGASSPYGYWSVQVVSPNQTFNIDHYTEGSTGYNNNFFTVVNGSNTFVNLVWHPQPPFTPHNTAACTGARIEDDRSGPTGSHSYTRVTISGTDNDQTNYPIGYGDFHIFTFSAVNKDVTITVMRYHNGSPPTMYSTSGSATIHCYHAQCQVTQVIADGQGPPGVVLAGHQFTLQVQVKNDNTDPNAETIPSTVSGRNFSITEPAENGHGFIENDTGFSLNPPGQPYDEATKFITLTAPSSVQNFIVNLYPDMWGAGGGRIGDDCQGLGGGGGGPGPGTTIPIYQQFNASGGAHSQLLPTHENPDHDNYYTNITVSGTDYPVNLTTYSQLAKSGSALVSNSGGQYSSTTYTLGGGPGGANQPVSSPPTAGDEYCASIRVYPTSGYVGPDHNVVGGSGDQTFLDCDRVVNEPYFKVYHSDISAGGEFDKCTTNGGTLAGYADISDPAGATRGSTTQLSALALLKITGVASAKTSANITGSPVKLTFANTGSAGGDADGGSATVQVDSSGNESPVLGGQFGGCRTLTNETAPASAQNLASSSTGAVPAAGSRAYKHTGNLTITGGTLGPNQNVSIFVDGNVSISGDITYGNGWQAGTAPSFILHATGNIYIAPGVKQLAGVYIAQSKTKSDGTADTTTGKIYTCADTVNPFSPMSAANLYNGCHNQLVIYGSFVADQINLMRSFGSLRDEIPNPPAPGPPGPPTSWGLRWTNWADSPYSDPPSLASLQSAGNRCTRIDEGSEPSSSTWWDNYLCVPGTSALKLAWTSWENSPDYSDPDTSSSTTINLSSLQSHGYHYCVKWDVSAVDPYTWNDNWLCANQDVHMTFGARDGRDCTNIREGSDPDGQWAGSGYWLCMDQQPGAAGGPLGPPTAKGPPYTACSNKPGAAAQLDNISCAGEIFEYSPALYLSNGGGTTGPPGGGSLQLQSITSLPPVL